MTTEPLFASTSKKVEHDSAIRDNRNHGKVGEWLQHKVAKGSKLSIVSAYFTVSAYKYLREQLDGIEKLRFLFGDPAFIAVKDGLKPKRAFSFTDQGLSMLRQTMQRAEAKACADWLREKAEIKSLVKPNFLHGKLYHVERTEELQDALMGSSNFTGQGLGFGNSNMELNMVIEHPRDRKALKDWFEELWNGTAVDVRDVKEDVLKDLKQLYDDASPELVYFKTLYHLFESYLEEQGKGGFLSEHTGFFESEIWNMLYDFQKDGVKGAINKVLKHGGCIIADSVGLGKTFEALAVIQYFERLNMRVLVLCPKKLANNWTIYQSSQAHELNPFKRDKFNYTVLSHTDMGRRKGRSAPNGIALESFQWHTWDLVVIDESHNFRGNADSDEDEDYYNRAGWLLEKVIKKGVKTRVLHLSATPVNTHLRDLRNQINLINAGDPRAMAEKTGITDVNSLLKVAQGQFTKWADPVHNPVRSAKQLVEGLEPSFFKLLDELTIARSRRQVKAAYKDSELVFPERAKPENIYPNIDTLDRFLSYDSINDRILSYSLAVFNPFTYLKTAELKKEYEDKARLEGLPFTQSKRENLLIHMMKQGFLKRLESSIHSFATSMERTIQRIEKLEKDIEEFKLTHKEALEADPDALLPGEDERSEAGNDDSWTVGKGIKYKLAHIDLEKWNKALERDRGTMNELWNQAVAVTADRDAKLAELKKLIAKKVIDPHNEGNKKVLVFTAFADTANYLYKALEDFAKYECGAHMALVTGTRTMTTFGENNFDEILTHFSPRSKNREKMERMRKDGTIDILIATDCISEGQNLQDCDYLVNYDIHWNPVRVIQRFGRIDRLGSTNRTVHLVNFWPTKDLDKYINLKDRVESRMALVDLTATGDDNLLSNEKLDELISEDLRYRNKQLKKLQEEVIDLEDMEGSLSLSDLTLDDFRIELLNFIKGKEDLLRDAPEGLYAVVPAPDGKYGNMQTKAFDDSRLREILQPGAIFCLRRRAPLDDEPITEERLRALKGVNQMDPYFLLYVRQDGTVRFNYMQPKPVLEMFRLLCQGHPEAYHELCALFDAETQGNTDMSLYNGLLDKGVSGLASLLFKKNAEQLTTDRKATVVADGHSPTVPDAFDLVTWLVIK
jgi:ERCC4-related helicase